MDSSSLASAWVRYGFKRTTGDLHISQNLSPKIDVDFHLLQLLPQLPNIKIESPVPCSLYTKLSKSKSKSKSNGPGARPIDIINQDYLPTPAKSSPIAKEPHLCPPAPISPPIVVEGHQPYQSSSTFSNAIVHRQSSSAFLC